MGDTLNPYFLNVGIKCVSLGQISQLSGKYLQKVDLCRLKVCQLHSFPTELFIINYNEAMQRRPMDSVQDSSYGLPPTKTSS